MSTRTGHNIAHGFAHGGFVGDLTGLNIENNIHPDACAFLTGDNSQRLDSA
jgi:hypothetical protein